MNFPAELWNKSRRELHGDEGRGVKRGGWRGWKREETGDGVVRATPSPGTSYKEISRGRPRKLLRDILTAITVFLAILVAGRRSERPDDKVKISMHKAKLPWHATVPTRNVFTK